MFKFFLRETYITLGTWKRIADSAFVIIVTGIVPEHDLVRTLWAKEDIAPDHTVDFANCAGFCFFSFVKPAKLLFSGCDNPLRNCYQLRIKWLIVVFGDKRCRWRKVVQYSEPFA